MDLSEFWLGMLGAAGAAAVGWFSGGFSWLYAHLSAWWLVRRQRRRDIDALPGVVTGIGETLRRQDNDRARASVRDTLQFKAIADKQDEHTRSLQAQDETLAGLKEAIATTLSISLAQFETSHVPGFVCDAAGNNILVNRAMCKLFGVDRDELLGRRWQRFVAPSELAGFLSRFADAQAGHYEFEADATLVLPDKGTTRVRVHTQPHPRDAAPATRWVGTIAPLKPVAAAAAA